MKISRRRPWLAGAIAACAAGAVFILPAGAAHAESNGGVRVMPLGDSITHGTQVPGGSRIGLWQRFTTNRYTVDFVGSQFNGPSTLGDHDHEGHPGWRIDQIDANIVGWLNSFDPHTVLLHIGTNDVLQNFNLAGAPSRLSTLIDRITNTKPTAEVFVAQIIPLSNSGQDAAARSFNAAIPGIVQSKVNAGRRVHLVDMHSALTTADLIDGVHPTAGGYEKMAAVWYSALLSVPGSIGSPGNPGGGNLLTNGNIESGTGGWSVFGGGTQAANTAVVHGGTSSLLRTGRTAAWNGPAQDLTARLTNGRSYTTSVWMRTQTGNPTGRVTLALTANGTTRYVTLAQAAVGPSAWALLSGTTTVSWSGTLTSARFYVETSSGTDNFYIDDAAMQ